MKKNDESFQILFDLPKNFEETLMAAAEDELKIAQRKWGILLDDDKKETILMSARDQLESKVSAVSSSQWSIGDQSLRVTVGSVVARSNVTLPSKNSLDLSLIYFNESWRHDYEPTGDSTPINEFDSVFTESILNWMRTAVFYGVGSYAG